MASKYEFYSRMAEETALGLTKSPEQWKSFLKTAGRNNRYPYTDQLMIFAQRPDATACAEYDLWNNTMRRYVRRGSKGIALIDEHGSHPRLKYVFDVSDTGTRQNSRPVNLWKMQGDFEQPVQEALSAVFGAASDIQLDIQLEAIARQLASDYWEDHDGELADIIAGSYLEEYDEDNRRISFINAATVSIKYQVLSRCVDDPDEYFEPDDFTAVFDYNSRKAVNALGNAVNEGSRRIFREIEISIRNQEQNIQTESIVYEQTERSAYHGQRTDLHAGRGLSDPGSETEGREHGADREIRDDEKDLSEREQTDPVQRPPADRGIVSASEGDQPDSPPETGPDHSGSVGERPGPGQDDTSAGMGTAHEQPESAGGGDHPDRAYIQLTLEDFLTEQEQINRIDRMAESEKPSANSFSQEDIDHVLRLGGSGENSRMRVAAEYMKGKFPESIADFLQNEYRGGIGLLTDSGRISVWFSGDGIRLARGDEARNISRAQVITWEDAASRIGTLLEEGRFATNVELEETAGNARMESAQSLWYLRHDMSSDAVEMGLLASVDQNTGRGFPDETEKLADALADPEVLSDVTREMQVFAGVYEQVPNVLRFHYHRIPEILDSLNDLALPWREYSSDMTEIPQAGHFITEDEVDAALCYGSSMAGGKQRIYSYFSENHPLKEQTDFLKQEYGIGGHSGAFANDRHSFENHDGKGILLQKSGCADISLTWNTVARRIASLVKNGRYLTDAELSRYEAERKNSGEPEVPNTDRYHVVEVEFGLHISYSVWDNDIGNYYRDRDGEVVYFETEQLAKDYCDDLNEEERNEANLTPLDRAKNLLDEYCMEEFGVSADFSDMTEIGIGYTTVSDEEIPIEASVDLVNFRLNRYLSTVLFDTRQYNSLEELIDRELKKLDFVSLMDATDDEIAEALAQIDGVEPEAEHGSDFPYHIGDIVYLEDGSQYIIEQIGTFDVQLRDPSQLYPIFRSESKENFLRLMGRYPQEPEHAGVPEQSGPQVTEEVVGVYHAEENHLPFDVEIHELHFEEPGHDEPEQTGNTSPAPAEKDAAVPSVPDIPAVNFRITDDHLGEGGPKQKYAANVVAIRKLLTLETEDRNASPEEQEILSRYVGWGSLADAFDPNKPAWAPEYHELEGLLTEEEYMAARASTLNAHYTSPTVIRAIYDAVGQMGFESGNILEPAMGVGNFFGLLPERMQGSRLYGVELDSISGRIAQKLYPKANITVGGFETTDRRDFFDLAIGNVPFGDYKVNDRPYNKLGFSIHNYFFAKALDQVRPGGVVAFVTSRYTMDAKSPDVRRYLAQRAELLGAIRLPNNAFRVNAGTDVVSDIIFLQKRDTPIVIEPDWVHLGLTPDGIAVNSYFVDHPEMVLGELTTESTQYGREECTVLPIPGADLAEQLEDAVLHIRAIYVPAEAAMEDAGIDGSDSRETIPADPDVKNYSFTAVVGDVYFREGSVMRKADLSGQAKQRVLSMINLRRIMNDLIEYQLEDYPDEMIRQKQQELETEYDLFADKFGMINSRANSRVFADDSSYYLLCSLENVDEDGNLIGKADMFTKRTIRPDRTVTSVDTPVEALAVSIGERGKPDLPFMAELIDTPGDYDSIISELSGVIFKDPMEASPEDETIGWHTADDYLSGNVREKLKAARLAAESDPSYGVNVRALEAAQPKDLDASEIDVRLGATWIDSDYIEKFMYETFETPWFMRRSVEVKFSPMTAEWQITGKSAPNRYDVNAYVTYGTDRANAYKILEDTLNLKDIRIYDTVEDTDGKQKRVLNKKETTLAQQKQQAIKDAFSDWVWKDPHRREALCEKYNELFNSTRPREYDGSHIHFAGMNPEIALRKHQRDAIAHILYGGNTMLAHEVGAGKTFEMAAAAMESKRLGLCQKSLFVVPNHLTIQWASEFLRLYPSAKLLVATRKDFETARRKKFCARIATGDYDAVIIGHSQFEKIPLSAERQEKELQEQIDEIEDAISSMKYQRGERFTIKQMEKTRRSLQTKLQKLTSTERKDDVVTFEQLGVDRLFVDESQSFKNLFLYTKMRNVAGLSTSEAQKSSDMFMKCRYLDEVTGGRGVVFATGTPVSNSMTELYTLMRYLQFGSLQRLGLTHFDSWASTFGEVTTSIELAPEGYNHLRR